MKQRNIGWRIDYVLATPALAATVRTMTVQREIGTSDHGPVVAEFALTTEEGGPEGPPLLGAPPTDP